MTTTDPYDPVQKMADRLEAIDATLGLILQTLQRLALPPLMEVDPRVAYPPRDLLQTPDALERLTPLDAGIPSEAEPRTVTSTDASWVFLNSTHKRRQGDKLFQGTAPPQRLGNPQAQLNPHVRRVPAIREEERHGEKTDSESRS